MFRRLRKLGFLIGFFPFGSAHKVFPPFQESNQTRRAKHSAEPSIWIVSFVIISPVPGVASFQEIFAERSIQISDAD